MKNGQWEVTEFGLESVRPGTPMEYLIEASRLLESNGAGQGTYYDWPVHMAVKTWTNIELFIEAFDAAIKHHKGKLTQEVDAEKLKATYSEARRRKNSL